MKKTLVTLALALAGVVTLTGFRGGCGRPGHDPAEIQAFVGDRVDDALDDLDATPAQRQQVHAVKDRLLSKGMALRAERQADRELLLAQWDAERPDAARLHALVDQRVEQWRAMAHEAVDAAVEVHGVLTPEQRARVSRKAHRWADR